MIEREIHTLFTTPFHDVFGTAIDKIEEVSAHASERRMARLISGSNSAIALIDPNPAEFQAFIMLTKHFLQFELPVPCLYYVNDKSGYALIQDLGRATLLDIILSSKDHFPVDLYNQAVEALPQFQIVAGKTVDFKRCHPRESFNNDSMQFDMQLFSKEYLQRTSIKVDHDQLNKDFKKLADFLLTAPSNFFMYRDFQSRNIMVKDNKTYFIDYQLGRRGPLQYDLASLLYQSRAQVPTHIRDKLIEKYLTAVNRVSTLDVDEFYKYWTGFVIIRLMQVLGRYAELGLGQNKQMFKENLPYAKDNLKEVLKTLKLEIEVPYLLEILQNAATA